MVKGDGGRGWLRELGFPNIDGKTYRIYKSLCSRRRHGLEGMVNVRYTVQQGGEDLR